MKIRAITAFVEIDGSDSPERTFARAAQFLAQAQAAFEQAGVVVQSRRIATQPYPRMGIAPAALPGFARQLRHLGDTHGVAYIALGPARADSDPAFVEVLPDVFSAAEGIFASLDIASPARGIDLGLLRRAAGLIQRISRITPDGLTNLYLCASANVPPGGPFFPAAYHAGGQERFALAIQAADLAVEAFTGAATPDEARDRLTAAIESAATQLLPVTDRLAAMSGVIFNGLDFSLAPYPGLGESLGGALERLGVTLGGVGAVAAASLVMNAIEAARFPRCGFSGLMLPVLEDTALGLRAGEGVLTINDLLLYSAVCGTGLDCIPLPGECSESVLAGVLLDVAALALRLNKPLTARLMPLPGKQAGDPAQFDFEYFVPSQVMRASGGLAGGALGGTAQFLIRPRRVEA